MITVTHTSLLFKQSKLRASELRRVAVCADIEKAKSDGDFKENFGYTEGLKERDMLDTRIAEIAQNFNESYQVIDQNIWLKTEITPETQIGLGMVVEIETKMKLGTKINKATYLIGGAWDNDLTAPEGQEVILMGYTSPLSRVLSDRKVGDRFEALLGRSKQEVHVVSIRKPTPEELESFYPNPEIQRIFGSEKELDEETIQRIGAGLNKHVFANA